MASTYEELIAKARELDAAGDMAGAKRLAQIAISRRGQTETPQPAQPPVQNTTGVEQFANGLNEGLTSLAGFPVDAMTGVVNAGVRGVNNLTGAEIPEISKPVGGSGMMQDGLSSVGAITDADPETRAQRYLRRGGQEIGFGLPAAALTGGLANGARMMPVLTASTAADSASAVAGQTAREVAPNNDALHAIIGRRRNRCRWQSHGS